jgi:hypothetical protein
VLGSTTLLLLQATSAGSFACVPTIAGKGATPIVVEHNIPCVSGYANGQGQVKYRFKGNKNGKFCTLSGTFKDGLLNGNGRDECVGESLYEGEFLNGEKEGQGIWYGSSGYNQEGTFKRGKLTTVFGL